MTKRYSRGPANYGRAQGSDAGKSRVHIVCEGSCTEPHYFLGLKQEYRLSNLEVDGTSCGSSPISVVRRGIEIFEADPTIDRIYCVIDRDEHERFSDAVNEWQQAVKNGIPIYLIVSYPCFELWYFYHEGYSRSPVVRTKGRSPGQEMVRRLKLKFPKYEKESRGMWELLRSKLNTAKTNSKRSIADSKKELEENPSTNVYELIEFLDGLS
jgi:hypothetical protein